MSSDYVRANISLPRRDLEIIDELAENAGMTRSDLIRQAVLEWGGMAPLPKGARNRLEIAVGIAVRNAVREFK